VISSSRCISYSSAKSCGEAGSSCFKRIIDKDSVERLSDNEWRDIDRALSAYNALGLYIAKGYVKESDVMDLWAVPISKAWKAAQPYLTYREHLGDPNPWKYLSFLAERAQQEISRTGGDSELKVWRREMKHGQR
jgi:hypothetical protein